MEDKERSLYCGNLSEKVTEDLLYELFLQAGPLENVTIPKDKEGRQKRFGFILFKHAVSVQYAVALMNGMSLYGMPLRLDARSESAKINPYLERLQQYTVSSSPKGYQHTDQGYYPQNDNRYPQNNNRYNRPFDSRRNDQRTDSRRNNSVPIIYPNYTQPIYFLPQLPPPPVNNYSYQSPNPYENYQNSRTGYRR